MDVDFSTSVRKTLPTRAISDTLPNSSFEAAAKPTDPLPDVPTWLVGVIAGSITFGLIVGILLYFANFPPTFAFAHGRRRQRFAYQHLHTRDYGLDHELEDFTVNVMQASNSEISPSTRDGRVRRRQRKNLSIDTSARYTGGLGITLPGDQASSQRRKLSFDEEAIRLRKRKPQTSAQAAWSALTSPLPAARRLVADHLLPDTATLSPVESSGDHEYFASQLADLDTEADGPSLSPSEPEELLDLESPYDPAALSSYSCLHPADVLGRLNDAIAAAVEMVAKVLHVPARGAEEGLLLPVRDSERVQVDTQAVD